MADKPADNKRSEGSKQESPQQDQRTPGGQGKGTQSDPKRTQDDK